MVLFNISITQSPNSTNASRLHDDVIIWKHLPRYWPLCGEFTGNRWIPLTKAGDAELWCFLWSAPWINGWVNNRKAGNLRRHRAHYDAIVMCEELDGMWRSSRYPIILFIHSFVITTSPNGNISALLVFVRGIHHRWWIPLTKTSDAELWCFLWCTPRQMVEQTIEIMVIWDGLSLVVTVMFESIQVIWHNGTGGRNHLLHNTTIRNYGIRFFKKTVLFSVKTNFIDCPKKNFIWHIRMNVRIFVCMYVGMYVNVIKLKQIYCLVQDCGNSIANALELPQSCTKPSKWTS